MSGEPSVGNASNLRLWRWMAVRPPRAGARNPRFVLRELGSVERVDAGEGHR